MLTDERTHHLLSVVVGLEDVADDSAARRLQNETKQPLVVLVRRTLKHSGERELQRDRGAEQTRSVRKRDGLRRSKPSNRGHLTLRRVTCVCGSMSLKRQIHTSISNAEKRSEEFMNFKLLVTVTVPPGFGIQPLAL